MNETPKCPYCGAEMELKYVCGEYFCLCAACEATSPAGTSKEAAVAAALHRAEPEIRPLTLEEISEKVYDTDWDFVWLETKGDIFQLQLCPRYVNEEVLDFCWPLSDDEIEENVEEMGKSWRCWPRKPTPEQMAAEKWEE